MPLLLTLISILVLMAPAIMAAIPPILTIMLIMALMAAIMLILVPIALFFPINLIVSLYL